MIISTVATLAPYGWLMCDATVRNKTDYEELWPRLPNSVKNLNNETFVIDMTNRAIMGAGSNGSLGTKQDDATAKNGLEASSSIEPNPHKHTYVNSIPQPIGTSAGSSIVPLYINAEDSVSSTNLTCKTSISSKDTETRPKNMRWNYIIKARP